MKPFRYTLQGSFYSYPLYDQDGKEIFYLDQAKDYLETTYPEEQGEVFNGVEADTWGNSNG